MTTAPEPPWLHYARTLIDTREAAGVANNATIIGWARTLGTKLVGMIYNADSVPWCGLFVARCMDEAGIAPAAITVRATSWATWGLNLRPERLAPGTVLVFARPGGGHVGFYVGEDAASYHVLGGNQGNAVSIARLPKTRCVASRWPKGQPVIGGPVQMLARVGVPLSHNEA